MAGQYYKKNIVLKGYYKSWQIVSFGEQILRTDVFSIFTHHGQNFILMARRLDFLSDNKKNTL